MWANYQWSHEHTSCEHIISDHVSTSSVIMWAHIISDHVSTLSVITSSVITWVHYYQWSCEHIISDHVSTLSNITEYNYYTHLNVYTLSSILYISINSKCFHSFKYRTISCVVIKYSNRTYTKVSCNNLWSHDLKHVTNRISCYYGIITKVHAGHMDTHIGTITKMQQRLVRPLCFQETLKCTL